jgi:hypothetical protein
MELKSSFLYEAEIALQPIDLGATPECHRVIYKVTGGTVAGPRIKGRVLDNGGDWLRIRNDGSIALDIRACIETDDGALIYYKGEGRIVVPAELMTQVLDPDLEDDQRVDQSRYYFRYAALFETASPKYAWLNGILAVVTGKIVKGGIRVKVFAIE